MCTGAERGGRCGGRQGTFPSAPRLVATVRCVRSVSGLVRQKHCSRRLPTPARVSACVRAEPSLSCKVSGRLRGEEDDPRAWCRGGHRWGWGLRGGGGPGEACPPQLPERADRRQAAERGRGLPQRRFQGGKPTGLASPLPGALVPGRRPARGGGEGGRAGGGRSNADAKVAASGHHFCARKLNPGLKVAAAPLAGFSAFPPPSPDYPERVRILRL